MSTTTARTTDRPLTQDGLPIAAKLPPGRYEFRPAVDGGVLVVEVQTGDGAAGTRPTREELEEQNRAGLARLVAAAGGARP